MLVPLAFAQWLFLLLLVRSIEHNGWLFYQGGDETYYWSTAWSFAHGHIPAGWISYGWSLLIAPLAAIFGANILHGLPAVEVIQVVVLLPVALWCVYAIAARISGRFIGYLTAALWVVIPYLAIPLFIERYHQRYVELFLPQALGLTGMGDFPSMVCVLVAAYLALKSLESGDRVDTVLAGLVAGFAIGIKPGNGPFLAAPFVAYVIARRWRSLLEFGVALVPAVVTLTLWKYRGLGTVPLFHSTASAIAAGAGPVIASLPGTRTSRYVHIDWHQLQQIKLGFREFFYSDRLVEVPFIAGVIGIARVSWAKAGFVAAWFVAFVVVKGSSNVASMETGSFFRLVMPGFPAFVIAVGALPLLIPRVGPRLAERFSQRGGKQLAWRDWRFVVPVALLVALPLVVIAALPEQKRPVVVTYPGNNTFIPVDASLLPRAAVDGKRVALTWPSGEGGRASAFYAVFRSHSRGTSGVPCLHHAGAADCYLRMDRIATVRQPEHVDRVRPGRWTYRVGVAANWIDDTRGGDVLAVSPPLDVTVR